MLFPIGCWVIHSLSVSRNNTNTLSVKITFKALPFYFPVVRCKKGILCLRCHSALIRPDTLFSVLGAQKNHHRKYPVKTKEGRKKKEVFYLVLISFIYLMLCESVSFCQYIGGYKCWFVFLLFNWLFWGNGVELDVYGGILLTWLEGLEEEVRVWVRGYAYITLAF